MQIILEKDHPFWTENLILIGKIIENWRQQKQAYYKNKKEPIKLKALFYNKIYLKKELLLLKMIWVKINNGNDIFIL